MKQDDTLYDEYWENLAKNRINKELDMSKIHSKEDYQYELDQFLRKKPQGYNIINSRKYAQIRNAMYEASKDKIITTRIKRRFFALYGVYEINTERTSMKGKSYTQTQYQDAHTGRFTTNPLKTTAASEASEK